MKMFVVVSSQREKKKGVMMTVDVQGLLNIMYFVHPDITYYNVRTTYVLPLIDYMVSVLIKLSSANTLSKPTRNFFFKK